MSEERVRHLLFTAITAIKSGEKKAARNYLDRALYSARDPNKLADIWFHLSEIEEDKAEKRKALEEALSYRMTHARARRALAVLDGRLKEEEIINPDAIPAPSTEDGNASADRFMCPSCGARMSFAPDGQTLTCDFCESGKSVAEGGGTAEERDFFSTMATLRGHSKPVARKVFHCDGCGAEFILPPNDISEPCAYCSSPHVVSHEETRELLDPDAIIPHAFDQRRAALILVDWVKDHQFTPQGKVLPPRGFYLPVWTFDFAGTIRYSGERYETQRRGFQEERVVIKEKGDHPVFIDDLVIPANHQYQKFILELIDSYNLLDAKPYDARYLVNWAAEAYEIALGDASLEARSRAYKSYKEKVRRQYSHLSNFRTSSADMAVDSYKLLMLPIWITTYPFDGKEYHVFINGETGAVEGELPKSAKKPRKKNKFIDWLNEEI